VFVREDNREGVLKKEVETETLPDTVIINVVGMGLMDDVWEGLDDSELHGLAVREGVEEWEREVLGEFDMKAEGVK